MLLRNLDVVKELKEGLGNRNSCLNLKVTDLCSFYLTRSLIVWQCVSFAQI